MWALNRTLAGWAKTLFSETRDAAVYCAIINPEFSPLSRDKNAGKPDLCGLTSLSTVLSEIFAISERAIPR